MDALCLLESWHCPPGAWIAFRFLKLNDVVHKVLVDHLTRRVFSTRIRYNRPQTSWHLRKHILRAGGASSGMMILINSPSSATCVWPGQEITRHPRLKSSFGSAGASVQVPEIEEVFSQR